MNQTERSPRRIALFQLFAVLAIVVAALTIAAVILLKPQQRVADTSSTPSNVFQIALGPDIPRLCLNDVVVPADSSALRLQAQGGKRPAVVSLSARSSTGPWLRTREAVPAGTTLPLVFPYPRRATTSDGNRICVVADQPMRIAGLVPATRTLQPKLTSAGREADASLFYEFLRPGKETGLEMVGTTFHRASLFKPAWVAPWVFYLALLAMLAAIAGAVAIMVRFRDRDLGHKPLIAIGAIAFVVTGTWALVTPAFQAPDELAHYAHTESIAQNGRLPLVKPDDDSRPSYTEDEILAARFVADGVVLNQFGKPPWTEAQQQRWRKQSAALGSDSRDGGGGYTQATNYSPLYYAVEAPGYWLGSGGSIFDRLWFMRLISALMAAATVVLTGLFVRELAPGVRWAAPAAALAVAFQPMFGFVSGAINNDSLLILCGTAELYLLARALQRGLDWKLGILIGLILGFGVAAKPTMVGLAPVVGLTVLWLLWRDRSQFAGKGLIARLTPALAVLGAVIVTAVLRYGLLAGRQNSESAVINDQGSLRYLTSYIWQWYLPRIPGMQPLFPSGLELPVYSIFIAQFWGQFGHIDVLFPDWVYRIGLGLTIVGFVLGAIAVFRHLSANRDWSNTIAKLMLGFVALAGVALLVNYRSYLAFVHDGTLFAQGRYLLCVIAVFGAAVSLAALGFGRRWGAVAATAAVTGMAFYDIFSMGLVLERFYT